MLQTRRQRRSKFFVSFEGGREGEEGEEGGRERRGRRGREGEEREGGRERRGRRGRGEGEEGGREGEGGHRISLITRRVTLDHWKIWQSIRCCGLAYTYTLNHQTILYCIVYHIMCNGNDPQISRVFLVSLAQWGGRMVSLFHCTQELSWGRSKENSRAVFGEKKRCPCYIREVSLFRD